MYNADVYDAKEFNKILQENIGDVEIIFADGEWFFGINLENPPYGGEDEELYEMLSEKLKRKVKEILVDVVSGRVAVIYE